MVWLFIWIGVLLVSAGGVIVSAHSVALERAVDGDMRDLASSTSTAQSPPLMSSEAPPPVERYLAIAGANGAPIRTARIVHGGTIRTSPDASWMPVRGRELFVADAPGFVWWGRMRIAPGVWVDARDELAAGVASASVTA